jgi:hypothetical protein
MPSHARIGGIFHGYTSPTAYGCWFSISLKRLNVLTVARQRNIVENCGRPQLGQSYSDLPNN